MNRRGIVTLVAALAAFFFFVLVRHYPPFLASLMGAAVGALVFAVQRTARRMRDLYRR